VKRVNARHAKTVPGRKSDVLDCQWLQQLPTFGLLAGAFRPPEQVGVLRAYLRQRATLVRYAASPIQHMQKALNPINVQLHHVVSAITGVTGLNIIRAIVAGERCPQRLRAIVTGAVNTALRSLPRAWTVTIELSTSLRCNRRWSSMIPIYSLNWLESRFEAR
jgi:transposase